MSVAQLWREYGFMLLLIILGVSTITLAYAYYLQSNLLGVSLKGEKQALEQLVKLSPDEKYWQYQLDFVNKQLGVYGTK